MPPLVYSPIDLSVALESVANIKFSVKTSKSDWSPEHYNKIKRWKLRKTNFLNCYTIEEAFRIIHDLRYYKMFTRYPDMKVYWLNGDDYHLTNINIFESEMYLELFDTLYQKIARIFFDAKDLTIPLFTVKGFDWEGGL
jgi:hypothetical protein